MESSKDTVMLLNQIPQPAFLVKENLINHVNHAAQLREFEVGMSVNELITIGKEEYQQFTDGQLMIVLGVNQTEYHATVVKADTYDVFFLDSEYRNSQLRAFALAAQNLREPLSNAMLNTERLLDKTAEEEDSALTKDIKALNKRLYEIHRLVSNMSDAVNYDRSSFLRMQNQNAVGVIAEIVEKAATLVAHSGHRIVYTGPEYPVFCQIDTERLERAILNLISNAVKHSSKCSEIRVALHLGVDKLYLSVQNGDDSVSADAQTEYFSRFMREPGFDKENSGIGLGLSIVRGAAIAHNGVVLINRPADEGLKFTMTIALKGSGGGMLRSSSSLPIDSSGGYDRALIELADILPPDVF